MASAHFFIIFATVAVFLPIISATEFIVGDEKGWTIGFDYQAWAQGKEFRVGDKLVFQYPEGAHNVLRVNGTGFQQCAAPASTQELATGNDVITLTTPGRKWYICGVGKHCEVGGMKLVITVQTQIGSPASSPSTTPSPNPVSTATASSPLYFAWMVAILSIPFMIAF